jgi:RimJ/RimL family protein N-acetyltransferase
VADLAGNLAARGERVELVPAGPGSLAVVQLKDGRNIGRLEVLPGGLGELIAWELCIDEAERGYGAGSEAARLFALAASQAGWTRLRARAHPQFGLSVYFWMRMGFRPLHGEGPEGGIWFVRRLT